MKDLDQMFLDEFRFQEANMFSKLRVNAVMSLLRREELKNLSVKQFFEAIETVQDVWDVVRSMGILTFTGCLLSLEKPVEEPIRDKRLPRLKKDQKIELKMAVVETLEKASKGLTRREMVHTLGLKEALFIWLVPGTLDRKIKVPLAELRKESVVVTSGARKNMRYLLARHRS